MDLFVATNNLGKREEFRVLLAPLSTSILFPPDLGLRLEVEETGATYAENARLKGIAYAEAITGRPEAASPLLVLADDSGLEVDALDGAPGIRSARYTPGDDIDRLTRLLSHMEGVPWEERTARFRCVVAIVTPEGEIYTAAGICEGVIAREPAGEGGFGYDPVFYLPSFDATMAELPAEVKNRVSHRARAVQAAMPALRRLVAREAAPLLAARQRVDVPVDRARRWFLELEEHPERYQFDTHAGFRFVQGNFGQVGSRFETREQFRGLRFTLRFELTEVGETHFRFRLLHPPLPIWCVFTVAPLTDRSAGLALAVGAEGRLGRFVLRLPVVRGAIRRQIRREVEHIAASMESLG